MSSEATQKVRTIFLQSLRKQYTNMKMKYSEKIKSYYTRLMSLVNEIKAYGEDLLDKKIVEKILISLPFKFDSKEKKDKKNSRSSDTSRKIENRIKDRKQYSSCGICKKINYLEKGCWHREKSQCRNVKGLGIWRKTVGSRSIIAQTSLKKRREKSAPSMHHHKKSERRKMNMVIKAYLVRSINLFDLASD
ncbi:hypothetical protein HN51_036393 [Arachis hypogaea]